MAPSRKRKHQGDGEQNKSFKSKTCKQTNFLKVSKKQTKKSKFSPLEDLLGAVRSGKSVMVHDILSANLSTKNLKEKDLDVALLDAVRQGNLMIVQDLMYHGADPYNYQNTDIDSKNCLHVAAEKGFIDIVELLVKDKPSNVLLEDRYRNTALILCQGSHCAAKITEILLKVGLSYNAKVTEMLRKSGAGNVYIDVQNTKGETALMKATEFGNIGAMLQLGFDSENWELKNRKRKTACDIAKEMGFDGLKEALVTNLQDNIESEYPTPIFKAVLNGNVELVELFCSSRLIDVDKINATSMTALALIFSNKCSDMTISTSSVSGENGSRNKDEQRKDQENKCSFENMAISEIFTEREMRMINALVKAGANIHITTNYPWLYEPSKCPLALAAKIGNLALVKFLLENADSSKGNGSSYISAIEIAVKNNSFGIVPALTPILQTLKASDKSNYNLLKERISLSFYAALKVGNEKCADHLIDLLDKDLNFETAMNEALKSGHYSMFNLVKRVDPGKYVRNVDQCVNWLCSACQGDSPKIVESLLQDGAAAKGLKDLKQQPLMHCKSAQVCELLLKNGARIMKRGPFLHYPQEKAAVVHAVESNNVGVLKTLIKYSATVDINLLNLALTLPKCQGEMREYLLTLDIDPNQLDYKGRSSLSLTVVDGDIKSATALVQKGADVNLKPSSSSPPLISAVEQKCIDIDMIEFLLDNDADVNIINSIGDSALIVLARKYISTGTTMKLLAAKGVDFNYINKDDCTALMVAAKGEFIYAFENLITSGADINFQVKGLSLLSWLLTDERFKAKFIKHLLGLGAKVSRRESMFAVHRCLAVHEIGILSALIHSGDFPPMLLDTSSIECKVQSSILERFKDVFSPLCMALCCNYPTIAHDMLEAGYVTTSDLTVLPWHNGLQNFLSERLRDSKYSRRWVRFDSEEDTINQSLNILKEMSAKTPTLSQLCAARLSEHVGWEPGRREKIKYFPLPVQKLLMFESGKCHVANSLIDPDCPDPDRREEDDPNGDNIHYVLEHGYYGYMLGDSDLEDDLEEYANPSSLEPPWGSESDDDSSDSHNFF